MIWLTVAKLPSGGVNKPVWLWWSGTGAGPEDLESRARRRWYMSQPNVRSMIQSRGMTLNPFWEGLGGRLRRGCQGWRRGRWLWCGSRDGQEEAEGVDADVVFLTWDLLACGDALTASLFRRRPGISA